MSADAPFDEHETLDQHRMEMHQAPLSLTAFGVLAALVVAGIVLGTAYSSVLLGAVGVLLGTAPVLRVLLPGRTRSSVTCEGMHVDVHAWRRWGPLRFRARVPLPGLRVTVEQRHRWKGNKYDHTITLIPAEGAPVRLERLLCTPREAARVKSVLDAHAASVRKRQGLGAREIPAALRRLQDGSEIR